MQINLDDNDDYATPGARTSQEARRGNLPPSDFLSGTEYSVPGDSLASGGWVSGGQFGEDGLAVRTPTDIAVGHYLNRINPNFICFGGFAIAAIYLLQGLVTTLGQANPNNHLMAASQVTAQANGTALTATTDALKTVANQRPSCIAIVCNFPRTAPDDSSHPDVLPAETFTTKEQQQTQDDATQQQSQANLSGGSRYPTDSAQPIAATALNVTNTPDYWRQQWQQQPDYVQQYIAYCQQQSVSWQPSDCQALYWTLQ